MLSLSDAPTLASTPGLAGAGGPMVRYPRRHNVSLLRRLHPYTQAYCERIRAGVGSGDVGILASPEGRVETDRFNRGLVNGMDWAQLVFFLLQQEKNAAIGSTVYSLGGGGIVSGTLVGGPTWGPTGVTTALNSQISFSNNLGISGSAARTLLICSSFAGQVNGRVSAGWGGGTASEAWLLSTNSGSANRQVNCWTSPIRQFLASVISDGSWSFWGASSSGGDAGGIVGFADGVTFSASGTGAYSTVGNFAIGRNISGSAAGQNQTAAFCLVALAQLSSQQTRLINTLAKTTILQGFGLT